MASGIVKRPQAAQEPSWAMATPTRHLMDKSSHFPVSNRQHQLKLHDCVNMTIMNMTITGCCA